MNPKEIAREWLQHYNSGDAGALAGFYHREAVNDRVASHSVQGVEAIKALYEEEFNTTRMECEIEHLHEDGPWVILEWKDALGFRGCVFFKIEDQKIVHQRSYWDTLGYMQHYNLPSSIH